MKRCLFALCAGVTVAGSLTVIATSSLYKVVVGPGQQTFSQPFFMAIIVALAMTSSFLLYAIKRFCMTNCRESSDGQQGIRAPLTSGDDQLVDVASTETGSKNKSSTDQKSSRCYRHTNLVLIPLAASDLTVSILDNVGFMLIPASVVSMINCAILVFCAITTRIILGTRHSITAWIGIVIASTGITLVGFSVTLAPNDKNVSFHNAVPFNTGVSNITSNEILGIFVTIGARVLQSIQFAFEERFMKQGRFHPLIQVGAEGSIELILLGAIVIPIVQSLDIEDVFQGFAQVRQTPLLLYFCSGAFVGLASLNPLSMSIGGEGGSVLRVFMDAVRSMFIWMVELVIYISADNGKGPAAKFGEPFSVPESFVELGGFSLICVGLVVYALGKREPESHLSA